MSLAELATVVGTTRDALALRFGVAPALFERIDNGRQPLPIAIAESMAAGLGLQLGEVLAYAQSWTALRDPPLLIPLPANPLFGERFDFATNALPQSTTQPQAIASPFRLMLRKDDGEELLTELRQRRDGSLIAAPIPSGGEFLTTNGVFAPDGTCFFGSRGGSGVYLIERDATQFTSFATQDVDGYDTSFDADTGVWLSSQDLGARVFRVDPATRAVSGPYTATLVAAHYCLRGVSRAGAYYVPGFRFNGTAGRLFKFVPGTLAATVASGIAIAQPSLSFGRVGVARTPNDGPIYFATGTPADALAVIDEDDSSSTLGISGPFNDVCYLEWSPHGSVAGTLWVSDRYDAGGGNYQSRLTAIDLQTNAVAATLFFSTPDPGAPALGRVVFDGGFLWVAAPMLAKIYKFNPYDILGGGLFGPLLEIELDYPADFFALSPV